MSISSQFSLSDFEAAVLIVLEPPSNAAAKPRFDAASAYIQSLSARSDAYILALHLLDATAHGAARFFALQALAQYVGGTGSTAPARAVVRGALIAWCRARGAALATDPPFVRAKLALSLALCIKRDYPETAPTAVRELVGLALEGAATRTLAGAACADVAARALQAVHDEVVDPRVNRPAEELAHNMLVKDALRAGGGADVNAVAAAWLSALDSYIADEVGFREISSSASSIAAAAAAAATTTISATDAANSSAATLAIRLHHDTARMTLNVMAAWADWCDATLFCSPLLSSRYLALLHTRAARSAVAGLLSALVKKGMGARSRLSLLRALGIVDIAATAAAAVVAALTPLAVPGARDDPTPYGRSGSDDDANFGEATAELLGEVGTALYAGAASAASDGATAMAQGGDAVTVAAARDDFDWASGALRIIVPAALALFEVAPWDIGVGLSVFSVLEDLIRVVARSTRPKTAVAAAAGTPGGISLRGGGGGDNVNAAKTSLPARRLLRPLATRPWLPLDTSAPLTAASLAASLSLVRGR